MKKAHALSMNELFHEVDGKISGLAELVLVCFEPKYEVTNTGQTIKSTALSEVRFHAGVEGMREMAKNLNEFADELEESQNKFNKE